MKFSFLLSIAGALVGFHANGQPAPHNTIKTCESSSECPARKYCSSVSNTCVQIGFCTDSSDCESEDNVGMVPLCDGNLTCTDGHCCIDCMDDGFPMIEDAYFMGLAEKMIGCGMNENMTYYMEDMMDNMTDIMDEMMDNMGENMGEMADSMGEDMGEMADNMGENMGEMADNMGENMGEMMNNMGEMMDNVGATTTSSAEADPALANTSDGALVRNTVFGMLASISMFLVLIAT